MNAFKKPRMLPHESLITTLALWLICIGLITVLYCLAMPSFAHPANIEQYAIGYFVASASILIGLKTLHLFENKEHTMDTYQVQIRLDIEHPNGCVNTIQRYVSQLIEDGGLHVDPKTIGVSVQNGFSDSDKE